MAAKSVKPKGATSSYAFFVKTCREEHRKKYPEESVGFQQFSKKCSEKWRTMTPKEKKSFEDMASEDKARYMEEKGNWVPLPTERTKKRKAVKDPNVPKRSLSAFFMFCKEVRPGVMHEHPDYKIGDIGKELGKRWQVCTNKPKFEEQAARDKERYAKDMEAYQKVGKVEASNSPKKAKVPVDEPKCE